MLEGLVHLRRFAPLELAALGVVRLLAGYTAHLAPAGGAADARAFVLPGRGVVGARLGIVAGEETVEIFGVSEVIVHDYGRVRVVDYVVPEIAVVLEDVVDDAAEEGYVGAGPDRDVEVRHSRGAREARINVDDLRPLEARLHHPLEAHWVVLGHVGAHDQDAVGVGEVLLKGGGSSPAERGPETRDRRGVSYSGLVLDLYGAHRGEELLD